MGLIKLFIISLIILGFLNTFVRSDFINIIVPTMILVIFYTSLNKNVVGYLHMFIIAIAATLGYDLLWFLFSSSVQFILLIFSLLLFSHTLVEVETIAEMKTQLDL
jgi:hypothetical protein